MKHKNLNASKYPFLKQDYKNEFEKILSKIIACYNLMLSDKVSLANDENSIRDVLLINYLNDNSVRRKVELTDYLFNREVPESKTIGRTDIKIETQNTFQDTDVESGKTYYYYLTATDKFNNVSDPSEIVSETIQ